MFSLSAFDSISSTQQESMLYPHESIRIRLSLLTTLMPHSLGELTFQKQLILGRCLDGVQLTAPNQIINVLPGAVQNFSGLCGIYNTAF